MAPDLPRAGASFRSLEQSPHHGRQGGGEICENISHDPSLLAILGGAARLVYSNTRHRFIDAVPKRFGVCGYCWEGSSLRISRNHPAYVAFSGSASRARRAT